MHNTAAIKHKTFWYTVHAQYILQVIKRFHRNQKDIGEWQW